MAGTESPAPPGGERLRHEEGLISSFVLPRVRARLRAVLWNPKRQRAALRSLDHFHGLDPRFARRLAADEQSEERIAAALRARGAPELCYTVSADATLDGRQFRLEEGLREVVGRGSGTFLSCVPARLAFFEGEDPGERYLLERDMRERASRSL